MYWLIGHKSPISLENKLTLYKAILIACVLVKLKYGILQAPLIMNE